MLLCLNLMMFVGVSKNTYLCATFEVIIIYSSRNMRNIRALCIFVFSLVLLSAGGVVRVSFPESFADGWDAYMGQTVQFTTPLYVCGVYYDSLLLSSRRLSVPEEHAYGLSEGDSTLYRALCEANRRDIIKLQAKYYPFQIMTGSVIRHLQARVVGDRALLTGQTPTFHHNRPSKKLPCLGRATLRVCAANIQNFFYDLGGYAGAKTREQQDVQTLKVAKGLTHLRADIYALCEIEKGNAAPQALVAKMNELTHSQRYAYIDNEHSDGDTISVGFIYRQDRVRPYGETQYAYHNPANLYHYRFMAHGFEEIRSGEKLIVSVSHPRSKRGAPAYSNRVRMSNMDSLLTMLAAIQEQNLLDDEDILIVGDFNCYTQEQPIQYLISQGYEDVLMRYDSTGYSYVYKGETGYLDRVFANPSMAAQITGVHPVHLNADCFYSLGYKNRRNKTMHRYSDHDPILIGVRLGR